MVGQAPIAGRVESILRVVPGVVRASELLFKPATLAARDCPAESARRIAPVALRPVRSIR